METKLILNAAAATCQYHVTRVNDKMLAANEQQFQHFSRKIAKHKQGRY